MSRSVFAFAVAVLIGSPAGISAAHLYPEAVAAWNAYVSATETRIAHQATPAVVPGGRPVVEGESIEVPYGLIHHWRGAVFIPKATVSGVLAGLQESVPAQEDVLESRILERRPDWMRVSLKLQRKSLVTVVYDTEHVVTFERGGDGLATGVSVATRVAEVEGAGTPQEHELPPGNDRGFLWRLNAYWRYQQTDGGVVAECDSISLSRSVPSIVKFAVTPIIDHAARDSMTRTLVALRSRFAP